MTVAELNKLYIDYLSDTITYSELVDNLGVVWYHRFFGVDKKICVIK